MKPRTAAAASKAMSEREDRELKISGRGFTGTWRLNVTAQVNSPVPEAWNKRVEEKE